LEVEMAYTVLDSTIVSSTVLHHGPDVVAIWLLLLATADRLGESAMQPSAAASLLRIPDERADAAYEVLQSPDPRSQNQDREGRRIVRLPTGRWLLTSHAKYQHLASKADAADRQRRFRERREAAIRAEKASDPVGAKPLPPEPRPAELPPVPVQALSRAAVTAIAKATLKSWSQEACDDWIERFGGTAPGGVIGKALKPLCDKHSWAVVRKAWRNYLVQTGPEYASPGRFANTFGNWFGDSGAMSPPKSQAAARHEAGVMAMIQGGLSVEEKP
jgi:hypothetical protein